MNTRMRIVTYVWLYLTLRSLYTSEVHPKSWTMQLLSNQMRVLSNHMWVLSKEMRVLSNHMMIISKEVFFLAYFTLSWKRQFSYQSEFFLKRESEEFGDERKVDFKFWNLANFVKGWWSEGWKMEQILCCVIGVIIREKGSDFGLQKQCFCMQK